MAKKKRAEQALSLAQTGASVAGRKELALALKGLGIALGKLRDRRVTTLLAHAIDGRKDPVEFIRDVEIGLLEEGNEIGEGFIAAAQAAVEAVSYSAVPSLGLLLRKYVTDHAVTRREYRAILGVLRTLDDAEFGVLRDAVAVLAKIEADPLNTIINRDPTIGDAWRWWSANTPDHRTLATGDLAAVVVDAIGPLQKSAEFEQLRSIDPSRPGNPFTTTPPEQRNPYRPDFRQRMVLLLADIMPKSRSVTS